MVLISAIKVKITLLSFISLLIGNFPKYYWQISIDSCLDFHRSIIIRPIGVHA